MTLAGLADKFRVWKSRFGSATYAQCGEDAIVDFIFSSAKIKNGVYLDIGAHHPHYLSNTYRLYRKGWSGFNVDPLADNIERFRKKRPRDTNICAGVGDQTETLTLYRLDPPTLSTFDKAIAEQYQKMGHALVGAYPVPFMTVADLMASHGVPSQLDLLSIDIEGNEIGVLQQFAALRVQPKVIICETLSYGTNFRSTIRNEALIQVVLNNGYRLFADTYINSIFVSNEFWQNL